MSQAKCMVIRVIPLGQNQLHATFALCTRVLVHAMHIHCSCINKCFVQIALTLLYKGKLSLHCAAYHKLCLTASCIWHNIFMIQARKSVYPWQSL